MYPTVLVRSAAPPPRAAPAPVAHFIATVAGFGPLSAAAPELRVRLLEAVKSVARRLDLHAETGAASGYDRRVLHDDPSGWSLAAIILRPGQQTHPHDHDGWGCAATVQGVERDRRFGHDAGGRLVLCDERDYPPGTGYLFDAADVHQPVGADPQRVTVSLHFLVQERRTADGPVQRHRESRTGAPPA
jgi:predicted metal-dependent enzyme (double-stranded beta helix superfamily)